jgi:hypothetical protein
MKKLGLCLVMLGFAAGCSVRAASPVTSNAALAGASKPKQAAPVLPLRRIRFFESGVAEFERSGVLGAGGARLPFPASDLDDVLKSLVVYRGDAPVPLFSASFDSVLLEKKARMLAHLPIEPTEDVGYAELLESLKGERVELELRRRVVRGRLVGITPLDPPPVAVAEPANPPNAAGRKAPGELRAPRAPLRDFELTLLGNGAAIERLHATDVKRIRLLDPAAAGHLERAIEATRGRVDQARRVLGLIAQAGQAVRIAYVTEAPIWRASYRLRLGTSSSTASLAGFGLLHNDTDEAWSSVTIELTNGEPDSFLLPLAAPRYWARNLKQTRESQADIMPQLGHHAVDRLDPKYRPERDRSSTPNRARAARPLRIQTPAPAIPVQHPAGIAAERNGYTYRVAAPVTVPAHTSFLTPFLNVELKAERGVWFKPGLKVGRAVVRLENTSANPLPAGTVSVFEGDRFSGEVELPELEPGRLGYFDFATELGVELVEKDAPDPTIAYRTVGFKDNVLWIRSAERSERKLEINNTAGVARTVFLPVDTYEGAVIGGADRVEAQSDGRPAVAVILVPAHERVARTLLIEQESQEGIEIEALELDRLAKVARQTSLPAASRAMVKEAARILQERQLAEQKKVELEPEVARLETRLRTLPVTQSSPRPDGPIATRYVALEAEKAKLEGRVAELERTIAAKNVSMRRVLERLPKES